MFSNWWDISLPHTNLGASGCISVPGPFHLHLCQPLQHGPALQRGRHSARGPQVYNRQVGPRGQLLSITMATVEVWFCSQTSLCQSDTKGSSPPTRWQFNLVKGAVLSAEMFFVFSLSVCLNNDGLLSRLCFSYIFFDISCVKLSFFFQAIDCLRL